MQIKLKEMRRHQYHHRMPAGGILPWFICILAAVFYCYEFFLRIAPSVVVKPLIHAYHVNSAQIGVLLAFYFYAYTPMQLLVGVMMDRYGPRRLLTLAVLMCALGAHLFQATDYIWVADVGRFCIGFGSAFAFVGVLKLATIWLPPERFALVSGFTVMLGMFGAIGADTELPSLVHSMGWRQAMVIGSVFGVLLAVLIWSIVRDTVPGAQGKFASYRVRNFRHAMKGLVYIIKDWRLWITGLVGGLMFMPTTIFAGQWGVTFLQAARGLPVHKAGELNSMIYWGWAIGGPIVGWLSDEFKRRKLPLVIGSCVAMILFMVILLMPTLPSLAMHIVLFTFGFFSSTQAIIFAISCELTPKKASGTVVSFANMIVMMGGMLVPPLVGYLLGADEATGITHQPLWHFQLALMILPIGLVIAFVLSFFLKETHCKRII